MALLIFKQWHRIPNMPSTPASNAQNIQYIGERVHVLKDDKTCENGLFGYINGKYFNDLPTKTVGNRIYALSLDGITMFRSVISFTPERAEMLELGKDKTRWENYVRSNIRTIAEKNGIDVTGLEWTAAVHDKKGQPHVHINFWNVKQKIGVNFVNAQRCNEIRDKLELDTFGELAEDMTILDEEEEDQNYISDNSDKTRRELISRTFEKEKTALHEAQNETLSVFKVGGKEIISEAPDAELIEKFRSLASEVPEHGQMSYAYMPDDVKANIKEYIELMLTKYPDMRELSDEYIELKETESKMYNSEESAIGRYKISTTVGKAKDKLEKDMANILLKEIKKYNFEQRAAGHDTSPLRTANTVLALLTYSSRLLRSTKADVKVGKGYTARVDLSKDAKRDLLNKYRDKEART